MAPFAKCLGNVCPMYSAAVQRATPGHDICVCAFQLEKDYNLVKSFYSQSARLDVDLACFWQQICAAVWRGTLDPELFEVGNCRFDLIGHEAVHVRAGRLSLPPGQD